MTKKTAYLWGPISCFTAPLAAWLAIKGWNVHIATKSSLNLFSLSPLDLRSTVLTSLEHCFENHTRFRAFQERIKLIDPREISKSVKYDALIFAGLPPNFDEARTPRAPWAASTLPSIASALKGVPIFLISSIMGAVQKDRVVAEEFEFERRKPQTHWEGICQHYENNLIASLSRVEAPWYLIRIPMISGSTIDGNLINFSGPNVLLSQLAKAAADERTANKPIKLSYNPDSTLWFMPIDAALYAFWRLLEDELRPRICNLVSTQATLNREWMHYLAEALGQREILESETDSLNLPNTLRKLLQDDIQVKTRNLFEVAGRYLLPPVRMDKEYFQKLFCFGNDKHWGQAIPNEEKSNSLSFSEQLATYYFESFVPSKFSEPLFQKVAVGTTSIGFLLKGADEIGWVIKTENGVTTVERFGPGQDRPVICFRLTGKIMTQLIQSKLLLDRALLMREVEVNGPLWQTLRITGLIRQFLKSYPFTAAHFASLQADDERVAKAVAARLD